MYSIAAYQGLDVVAAFVFFLGFSPLFSPGALASKSVFSKEQALVQIVAEG